jgi:hypothetical protein
MTAYLADTDLATYFDREVNGAITNIVARTNALVDEEWANPVFPVPQWVTNIAWDVAIRAGRNTEGVTSSTESWDDITVTKRWEAGEADGVYLTDEERARLNSATSTGDTLPPAVAPKSIRMSIPGWSRGPCS